MSTAASLTLDEVADRVGVHYQTVYRWVRSGKLRSSKVNGAYVVHQADLDEFERGRHEPTPPPRPTKARVKRQQEAMARALTAGDETTAGAISRDLLSNGLTVTSLLEDVIVPPLVDMGAAWHRGELAIYVEHRATGIVERLLGQAAPNPRGRRRGTALVAALSGDVHSLPTSMAAAALREDNWHVEHLGADMPPPEIASFVDNHPVDVVVISATMANPEMVDETRVALEIDRQVPVIVGGPGATLTDLQSAARAARLGPT